MTAVTPSSAASPFGYNYSKKKKKKKKKENTKLTFILNIKKLLPIRRPGQGQTPVLQQAEIFTNTYMNNLNLQHEKKFTFNIQQVHETGLSYVKYQMAFFFLL